MNKKGMGMLGWSVFVAASIAVLGLLFGIFITGSWTENLFGFMDNTKCGVGNTTGLRENLPTACTWYKCGESEGMRGTSAGGCPTKNLKKSLEEQGVEGEFIDQYKNCCSVKRCSGIEDKESEGGDSYPRKAACFNEDCDLEDKEVEKVDKEVCISYSQYCKEKDGCCCVMNPEISSLSATTSEEDDESTSEDKGCNNNKIDDRYTDPERDIDCGGEYCEDCKCVLYEDKFHYYGDEKIFGKDHLIFEYIEGTSDEYNWIYKEPRPGTYTEEGKAWKVRAMDTSEDYKKVVEGLIGETKEAGMNAFKSYCKENDHHTTYSKGWIENE